MPSKTLRLSYFDSTQPIDGDDENERRLFGRLPPVVISVLSLRTSRTSLYEPKHNPIDAVIGKQPASLALLNQTIDL